MNSSNKRPSGRWPLTPFLRVLRGFIILTFLSLASCSVEPGPLYGTWADNKGNTLSFFDDNTFSAKITGSTGSTSLNYSGNYSLLLNSLTMNCTEIELRIVTEWDIRGNILYLNWVTTDGDTMPLTLFKVSN
jgi:hypothetical protein